MSGLTETSASGKFLNIVQGSLRMNTTSDDPKAKKREWEKDGKSGVKYERVYAKISGHITKIEFRDSEYGEQIQISISTDEGNFVLCTPTESRYAINFMRRLPLIQWDHEVELIPYDIEDGGKRNVGIKVTQNGEVVRDYYWDSENKKSINGIPVMNVENPDRDDWKVYFVQVKKFLKQETITIVSNWGTKSVSESVNEDDDLPF